ncbi:hypothetical protein QBC35DRAFT_506104 [Podospora australis]|uniref:Zn(2)-C6 fungal-type domain-containing protein n=1 Tax=Podospora australis TaxID=1536484 RepID=A0AAN7AEL0_9PEZI|nr:hypothetical protein QBC35DRAFT_506104 [Podospora australis]
MSTELRGTARYELLSLICVINKVAIMVFPGRFSTGCLRCRQRKVKCDETKPGCRRCSIYGKPCTGYTDQFHFRHTRVKSESAAPPSPPVRQAQQLRRQSYEYQPHDVAVVPRAPEVSYEHASLCYFVSRFVSPDPADGFPAGHLSFLPGIYDNTKHGLLETATLSVAQMAAYNKFGGDKFKVQSYQNYGKAIRLLQDAVQSEDQATDDKVIAAILLLCTLKDINGEEAGDPSAHAPGLFYLIEKRGHQQMATSRGTELFFLALIRLQVYAFLHEDDAYVDPGAITTMWGVFDPLLRAMSFMSKTLSLRHKLMSFYDPSNTALPPSTSDTPIQPDHASVIQGCFEALDDFHAWDTEAAAYWQSMFEGRGVPTALGQAASRAPQGYDVETACTIILIRSARLILLMSMIAYIPDMADWGTLVLEQEVDMTINDILACVPYALGDVRPDGQPGSVQHDGAAAIMIHQSIRLVASCAYASSDQLEKANEILSRLNAGIGIRAAVGVRNEDLNHTRWAREQDELRARKAARWITSPSLVGEIEESPTTESPDILYSPLVFEEPWEVTG